MKLKVRTFSIVLFCCFYTGSSFAQSWQWAQKIGITNTYDNAEVIKSTTDLYGNTYAAIGFDGQIILNGKSYNNEYGSPLSTCIIKLNACGQMVWVRQISTSTLNIYVYQFQIDQTGNIYIFGQFTSFIQFNDPANTKLTIPGNNGTTESGFVCKYSSDGVFQWARFTLFDFLKNPNVNASGFQLTTSMYNDHYIPDPHLNAWDTLRLYSPDGSLVWKKKVIVPLSGRYLLKSDEQSFWILCQGGESSTAVIDDDTFDIPYYNTVLFKLDSKDGRLLNFIKPPNNIPSFNDWKVNGGSAYLVGSYAVGFDSLVVGSTVMKPSPSVSPYGGYVAKFSLTENQFKWAFEEGDVRIDGNFISVGNNGNIFVAHGPIYTNKKGRVSKYDTNGNLLWTKYTGGDRQAYVALGVDASENVYLGGYYGGMQGISFDSILLPDDVEQPFLAKIASFDFSSCMTSTTKDISLCDGEVYQFDGQVISSPGLFKKSYCSVNGCDSLRSVQISYTSIVASITENGDELVASPDGDSYEWFDCTTNSSTGNTTKTFALSASGSYSVKVTKNNCSSTSACFDKTITEVDPVSKGFSVTPNPSKGQFILNSIEAYPVKVSVYSSNGLKIRMFSFEIGENCILNLLDIADGLYLLKIESQNSVITAKIIKQN